MEEEEEAARQLALEEERQRQMEEEERERQEAEAARVMEEQGSATKELRQSTGKAEKVSSLILGSMRVDPCFYLYSDSE